jgi:LacI family transcriptional regulator
VGRPVSIKTVAEHAGVSVGTVSNFLNRPDALSPSTRERVREAVETLGFVRNESARHLRAGRSRTVGLVVLDIANPFFTDVARGVEDAANEAGLSVILCNSDGDAAKEGRYLDILAEQRVRGVLIVPADGDQRRIDALRARGVPVVLLDRRATRAAQCSVSVDDVAGGRTAVEHLLGLGHLRIAYVGSGDARQVADRRRGANEAVCAAADGATLGVIGTPSLNVAGGRAAGLGIAAAPRSSRPTAVFCVNDLVALGVLQALTREGLDVPGDVAIVGYDDIDFASAAAVPLTSIRQPRQQLGRAGAELLVEEAQGGAHRHRRVVFGPELVVRDSSAPRARRRRQTAPTGRP